MSLFRRTLFAFCTLPILIPGLAQANPAHKAAFSKHFGSLLHERSQTCAMCHVAEHAEGASSLEEFPHNSFGNAVRLAGERLEEEDKDDAISERVKLIAANDVDDDGVSNLLEILLGSFPGDESDVPDKESLAGQAEIVAVYEARLKQYAWRPFQPVKRPAVPQLRDDWGRNPIDAFIAEKLFQHRLTPMPEAPPEQLLRRVYLDLIGLSPTPGQIQEFTTAYERDPSAYDRVVDTLLEHPGYGERWGRHWMDVWRYSDWAGYKDALRESQRHIWHWRDWIVESLNEDKGYDQIVMQMLAADEMNLGDDDLRATGYLARNYHANREQWMDNLVKHTSQAFLGVTLGCAKCHDHMTDPFEQVEYYGMRAVFESYNVRTDRVPGELDIAKNGIPRAYDNSITAKTYLFERGDERRPIKDEPISPLVPESLGGELQVTPVSLSATAARPDQRPFVIHDLVHAAEQKMATASHDDQRAAASAALEALQAELNLEALESEGMSIESNDWKESAKRITLLQREAEKSAADWTHADAERKLAAIQTSLQKAKDAKNAAAIKKEDRAKVAAEKAVKSAADRVKKAVEAIAAEPTTEFKRREQKKYPDTSSGRRLAFATWLTDRENPLAARVAMNHIWLRHFGRAIVPTVNDFGSGGREPTHPALLDWLASELMLRDWSMKQMHRLVVTSATYRMTSSYRMASTGDAANQTVDPSNDFYWRGTSRRMEGEVVRDNLLAIADRMDASMGGPDIDNKLDQSSRRRSLYLRHAHEKLGEFVQIFDGPSVSECYVRDLSIQPHQALALSNSKLAVDAAKAIVDQLQEATTDDDTEFIRQAFLRVLARSANADEAKLCLRFLSEGSGSRRDLVLVLLNHNDFVAIR